MLVYSGVWCVVRAGSLVSLSVYKWWDYWPVGTYRASYQTYSGGGWYYFLPFYWTPSQTLPPLSQALGRCSLASGSWLAFLAVCIWRPTWLTSLSSPLKNTDRWSKLCPRGLSVPLRTGSCHGYFMIGDIYKWLQGPLGYLSWPAGCKKNCSISLSKAFHIGEGFHFNLIYEYFIDLNLLQHILTKNSVFMKRLI